MLNRRNSDSLWRPPPFIRQLQACRQKAQDLFSSSSPLLRQSGARLRTSITINPMPQKLSRLGTDEARVKSERIDAQLASEAAERAKEKGSEVTVLLLGQSESGKSTLQKQFQLLYAPNTFDEERAAWRAIIFINIISAVRDILQALEVVHENYMAFSRSSTDNSRRRTAGPSRFDDPLHIGRLRLSPLLSMEPKLVEGIGAGYHTDNEGSREVFVRQGWQTQSLATWRTATRSPSLDGMGRASLERDEPVSETSHLLDVCKDYIRDLSGHPSVTKLIKSGKIVLKESSTFFLSELDRLSSPQWTPTDVDILCARVRTVGIATHTYLIAGGGNAAGDNVGVGKTRIWHIFDVGGTRGQRKAWLPFFEGITATFFLAPVSAFDEFLDEAPTINRIDDSIQLFSSISSSPLLQKSHMVLFLNKADILKRKLRDEIKIADYIVSFAPRPNEIPAALQFFRDQFSQIFYQTNQGGNRRNLYVHVTSVVDIVQMKKIINIVVQAILWVNFQSSLLL